MLSSPVNRTHFYLSLAAGVLMGVAFLKLLPLANLHAVFLWTLPLLCLLFLGIALNLKNVIAGLLFTRALLDPVLNTTKIESLHMGFGAVLNLFVLLITGALLFRNFRAVSRLPFFKKWMVFLAICFLAVLYSPMPMEGIKLFFDLLSYLCMALLPFLIDPDDNDKRYWVRIILWSSALPLFFADIDMARGGRTFEDAGNRILGTFSHPNILAFYLVFVIALVFYAFRSGQFRPRGLAKAALVLYFINALVLLVATKTRNAWIACWLLFFIYGLLRERKYVFFALVGAGAAMLLPSIASRAEMSSHLDPEQLNSFQWRWELWKSAMPLIHDRFFFGYGLSTFNAMSHTFFLLERKNGADAHNTYVQILFETGIVGLLAYLSIYVGILRTFFSRVRKALPSLSAEYAIILAYLLTYLISSFADNMFYYLSLNWYVWFLIGVMLKAAQFHGHRVFRRRPVV